MGPFYTATARNIRCRERPASGTVTRRLETVATFGQSDEDTGPDMQKKTKTIRIRMTKTPPLVYITNGICFKS